MRRTSLNANTNTKLLGALAILCFGSFSWGVCRHFRRPGRSPRGMQVISLVSIAGMIVFLAELSGGKRRVATRMPMATMIGALGLFWWAVAASGRHRLAVAFTSSAPGTVLQTGPWRLVRHPFYSSYLMFWSATIMAVGGWAWMAASLLGVFYLVASRREERRFTSTPEADTYAAYRRETPMFVPWRLVTWPVCALLRPHRTIDIPVNGRTLSDVRRPLG